MIVKEVTVLLVTTKVVAVIVKIVVSVITLKSAPLLALSSTCLLTLLTLPLLVTCHSELTKKTLQPFSAAPTSSPSVSLLTRRAASLAATATSNSRMLSLWRRPFAPLVASS